MTLEIPGAYFVTENGKRTLVATTFRAGGTMDFNNQTPTNTFETLRALFGESKPYFFPTNAGWTQTTTASGSVVVSEPMYHTLRVTTATAPNSTILAYTVPMGLNTNTQSRFRINWDKKLSFFFMLARDTSNAAQVGFVQLKEAVTIGQIAAKGIEVKISNLAMEGYAYGTSLSSAVSMGNLTSTYPAWIRIDVTSSGVEFFVDNVSKGSITTAGKFPTGNAGANSVILSSSDNGGTATQCDQIVGGYWILQEV